MASVVNLYQTLTNIMNRIAQLREEALAMEQAESGTCTIAGEEVTLPPAKLAAIQNRLALMRTKVRNLANTLVVEIVYK